MISVEAAPRRWADRWWEKKENEQARIRWADRRSVASADDVPVMRGDRRALGVGSRLSVLRGLRSARLQPKRRELGGVDWFAQQISLPLAAAEIPQ